MKTRLTVAVLLTALLVLVAASALADLTFPDQKDMPACPEVPAMSVEDDGTTLTATFSEPIAWAAGIWNWHWVNTSFTDGSQTAFTLDVGTNNKLYDCTPGFGTWGGGVYDMGFAFDVVLMNDIDVKYDSNGNPTIVTVNENTPTEYFGNGAATATQYTFKKEKDALGRLVTYPAKVQETYEDGSSLIANYSMYGLTTRVAFVDANGNGTVLYDFRKQPKGDAENDNPVIFEGEIVLAGITDWSDGWPDRADHYSLDGALDGFASGQLLKVTFNFPYDDWKDQDWSSGPNLIIQPTDNWVWGQFATNAADKAQGFSLYSYDDIVSTVGELTADRNYAIFSLYPVGQDITVTRIEIVEPVLE